MSMCVNCGIVRTSRRRHGGPRIAVSRAQGFAAETPESS